MSREKSDSITHLVKIVANEEIDKRIRELKQQVPTIIKIDGSEFIQNIVSSVTKAGVPWTNEEDLLFEQEVRTAVAQIAKNHKRSIGAVKARISQKQLTLG